MKKLIIGGFILCFYSGCSLENREVNPETGPDFSEIHENLDYHFDKVIINGYEYLILERDRNNPHEGFGFMALTGNKIGNNQDSIKAYLKTLLEVQSEILSKLNNESKAATQSKIENILTRNFNETKSE